MRKASQILILLFAFTVFSVAANDANPRITPTVRAVYKVLPSVVNLRADKIIENRYANDFDRVFESMPGGKKEKSLGSGSIIAPEGLIVTNSHVVYRAAKITVILADGRKFSAREIANDELNDIALLKLNDLPAGTELKPIETAKPGRLLLGETVIALGNPFGLGNTVTKGIISALNRKITYRDTAVFSDIIQTDTNVYPGCSGGPLVNINGNMIGMNTAIFRDAEGIGFAIPVERVQNILGRWLIPERFRDVVLGFSPALKDDGTVFVKSVVKDSPAWDAGLRANDTIVSANGKNLSSLLSLGRHLWKMKAGDKITLKLGSGRSVTVETRKLQLADGKVVARIRLGLSVQPLTPEIAEALGYPFHGGLIISHNDTKNSEIERGDILVRLGDINIHNNDDIARALWNVPLGAEIQAVVISVKKHSDKLYLYKKLIHLKVK